MKYSDIDLLEQWWIKKSRVNFLAYRKYMRCDNLIVNWFVADLCARLQQFYFDLIAKKRPVLLIQTPPQHGKSIAVMDFIGWLCGKSPAMKVIFASYSNNLGVRCNLQIQRTMDLDKYRNIFPEISISTNEAVTNKVRRNSEQIEFMDKNGYITGGIFRNTTVQGAITGETLDVGFIDDPVKGREEASSLRQSQKIWEWFTDDFLTRLSRDAGFIVVMTRWTTHDLVGRLLESQINENITLVNYPAIAVDDEKYRKTGEALFSALKPLDFLLARKAVMPKSSFESLYQGAPTVAEGNIIKESWFRWWKDLPTLIFKFITADTAQKEKTQNDWTDLKCWGYDHAGFIYLLDHWRGKPDAPSLRNQAELFYRKHNTPKQNINDPLLRGMYIEDRSSGTGLIQELKKLRLNVFGVPRVTDKFLRCMEAAPFISNGFVYINTEINDIDNTLQEAREFPNSKFDDDLDTVLMAIEICYITNQVHGGSLAGAMGV